MTTLHLVRGIPGSGKTRLVRRLARKFDSPIPADAIRDGVHNNGETDFAVYSADGFFEKDGGYEFDHTRLAEAHASCMRNTFANLPGMSVFVHNTFVYKWEMAPYMQAAWSMGARVKIHEIVTHTLNEVKTCIERNVHGVPPATIARMAVEMECVEPTKSLPPEISITYYTILGHTTNY